MNPRRSAIDHILTLVGQSALADSLVLRGSVTMLAWAGSAAREPGDIDWVTRPVAVLPQERFWPYPYVDGPHRMRTDPETVHIRPRDELWAPDELDAEGFRPRLPPEGLHWLRQEEIEADGVHWDVVALIAASPQTPDGVRLDAENVQVGNLSSYYAYSYGEDGGGGVRVTVPFEGCSVQLDFAYDEALPEPPVATAIPRADGSLGAHWTASPALSLAWKLQWLAAEGRDKDLYDAVLLAELPGLQLSPRLRRLSGIAGVTPDEIRQWPITDDTVLPGGAARWLERLAVALGRSIIDSP
ncbi:hypothetical protein [Dactylosporangium sp. CA-233914]|uniref:hypothetical protein n=1 Tax=Dactylosporangium sp. CA-233914 TaxID=3239934 RepID=UPI003D8DB999